MDTAEIIEAQGGPYDQPKLKSKTTVDTIGTAATLDSQLGVEIPPTVSGKIELEIQRVRQQIQDMADQLKDAFKNEKYEQVKVIGEKKKELEEKLKTFEDQYSNDKVFYEMESMKQEVLKVDADMKKCMAEENYAAVAELGVKKKELQNKLAELESNFGLHNSVFQVGDRVSVTGLTSPRGGVYNGLEGVITEYLPEEQRYKVVCKADDGTEKTFALQGKNLDHVTATADGKPETARQKSARRSSAKSQQTAGTVQGKSQTRQLEGEIKLWFPRKHFGFLTPDNKPENEPDIFFHGTHVENREEMPIKRFARVKFSVIPAPKGPQARDVSITSYQPEKEAEAEAAEAAANGQTVGRSPNLSRKNSRPRGRRQKSNVREEISIEDPLGPVSPEALGLSNRRVQPSWARSASMNSLNQKPRRVSAKPRMSLNARAKPFLSSIDEKRQARAAQVAMSHPPPPQFAAPQRRPQRNWGSLSSEMGGMRWDSDSIRDVSDFFAKRASAGPVKADPSQIGHGTDAMTASMAATDQILAQIRPELFKHHYGVFAAQAKAKAQAQMELNKIGSEIGISADPSGGRRSSYTRKASIDLRKMNSEENKTEESKSLKPNENVSL